MSQYPSPYTPPPVPPNYGYDFSYYQPDLLGPARRASVIMFVVGGLLALAGLCCGAVGAVAPIDQIMSQNPALSGRPGITPELMKVGVIVLGVLALLFGMALLVLGYFVRGGGVGSIVTSIILVGMAVLLGGLMVLSALFELGSSGGGPELFAGMCMYVLPLVLLVALLAQLIAAAKMTPHIATAKSQYQQQYWQYQQQQQMYQAGYTAPPQQHQQPMTQPPAPVPPPPPSADVPPPGDSHGPTA